ncbi:MAG: cysteine dioxygenase [Stackebrandtia sp.]
MSTGTAFRAPDVTQRLCGLVSETRKAVLFGLSPLETADLVAAILSPHLEAPDLLTAEQCRGDPARYRQHLLYAEPDGSFSIVGLVWLPGHETPIHDHISWCVTGVHRGQENERRYRQVPGSPASLVATEDVVNPAGTVCGFAPPGDIHKVRNATSDPAISLHVYGADIHRVGSSIRRVYPANSVAPVA